MTSAITDAVFDCVVLLQAAISKKGPAFACMELVRIGQVQIFLSSDALAEITDVLNRPKLRRKFKSLTPEVAANFLRDLSNHAEFLPEVPDTFVYPRDPDDEPYVNLAVTAGVRYLVTWDNDLLDLMDESIPAGADFRERFPALLILDPVAFLRELSAPRKD
jgi:putative PIN family toxin of toxin-antitoxin system